MKDNQSKLARIYQSKLARIYLIANLYFEPWGAGKAVKWEASTGKSFEAEEALRAIREIARSVK